MANYSEVMDLNQRSAPKKGKESKREIRKIEHERSANGGHVFTHHMENAEGSYHEPEMHAFGKEEGREALAHFAEHAGLSEHMGGEDEDEPVEDDEDSAAGAAT